MRGDGPPPPPHFRNSDESARTAQEAITEPAQRIAAIAGTVAHRGRELGEADGDDSRQRRELMIAAALVVLVAGR